MKVEKTTDYKKFKLLLGNRSVNDEHLSRIVISMKNKFLVSPILVNEQMQIIDGQHRFTACKTLGLPIYYVVVGNYGTEEVKILNTTSSNWSMNDYMDSYCNQGDKNYIRYREIFMNAGYSHTSLLVILKGIDEPHVSAFKNGLFELDENDIRAGEERLKMLKDFKPYFYGLKTTTFIRAILKIWKTRDYSHDRMCIKMEEQGRIFQKSSRISEYLLWLEETYNFRSSKKSRVFFH